MYKEGFIIFLSKALSILNRWPLPSLNECLEMSGYIAQIRPTRQEFATYYRMGLPKARSILDSLRAVGLVSTSTRDNRYFPSELYLESNTMEPIDLTATMYFFYSKNSILANWLIHDVFYVRRLKGLSSIRITELKQQYYTDFQIASGKKYWHKPVFSELYSFFGNFSDKAHYRSLFSNLEMFHVQDDDFLMFNEFQPSVPLIAKLMNLSCQHFYKGISTFSIPTVLESDNFPFKDFLLTPNETQQCLKALEAEGYIRVVQVADLNHVFLDVGRRR